MNNDNMKNSRNNDRSSFFKDSLPSNHNKTIENDQSFDMRYNDELQRTAFNDDPDHSLNSDEDAKLSSQSPKARYRCKLCGQPKQNHTCPYQQSLQRSIGTMSYPALNSFECSEPGKLAPSLVEMNNFFIYDEGNQLDTPEHFLSSPSKTVKTDSFAKAVHTVTPDAHLSKVDYSTEINDTKSDGYVQRLRSKKRKITIQSSFVQKGSDKYSNDYLLLSKVDMKPEQNRVISSNHSFSATYGSYTYPTLPLTYSQRRCMSDSLFNLSKTRFGLTDECSAVLQEAQRNDSWDLAVAELITQLLVVLYCPMGDKTLEGLHRYLLSFGISC